MKEINDKLIEGLFLRPTIFSAIIIIAAIVYMLKFIKNIINKKRK